MTNNEMNPGRPAGACPSAGCPEASVAGLECGSPAASTAAALCGADDADLEAIVQAFALGEVRRHGLLGSRRRLLVTLAACVATGGRRACSALVDEALREELSPVEVKEVLYHCVPYAGLSRVADFLTLANDAFRARGVSLPLPCQSTVPPTESHAPGLAVQKSIFGAAIDRMYATSPADEMHIQRFLSSDCFGHYYTRRALGLADRELVTFAVLVSLGGCEPQVKGHIAGNAAVGNGRAVLLDVITQLLPFIGYPRTLNALACLDAVLPPSAVPQDGGEASSAAQ